MKVLFKVNVSSKSTAHIGPNESHFFYGKARLDIQCHYIGALPEETSGYIGYTRRKKKMSSV